MKAPIFTLKTLIPDESRSLARWIPALSWLRAYDRTWLRGDVFVGVTLAASLLPAALGNASLAIEVTAQVHR